MNSNLIFRTDVLDIIFENRNKDYGAYILRKYYPGRVKRALGLIFLIVLLLSAFTFLPSKQRSWTTQPYIIDQELAKVRDEIKLQEKKNEPVKKEMTTTPASEKKLIDLVIVPKDVPTDIIQAIEEKDVISNKTNVTGNPGPVPVLPEKPGVPAAPDVPAIDINTPMDINSVDEPPAYPGGMDALRKFMERNLRSPKEIEERESVTVRIKFVVGNDGKLQSFVIVEDGGEEFNKEVIRVLKRMPDWIPGKTRGHNVSVYYTIPVKFVPEN